MLDRLPTELLVQIVAHIDDENAIRKLYVSGDATIRTIIAPVLFNTVDIMLWMMDIDLFGGPARHTRVALTDFGAFGALFVDTLLISAESSPEADEEFQNYLDQVFPSLVNLKKFSMLHSGSQKGTPYFSRIVKRLATHSFPFSLTHFIWQDEISDATVFAGFLAAQPNMTYLEVATGSPALQIPPDALTRLKYLKGDRDLVFNILPGRNVEHVSIDLLESPQTPISCDLDKAFRQIKSLSFPAFFPGNAFDVARLFVELEYLRVLNTSVSHAIHVSRLICGLGDLTPRTLQIFKLLQFFPLLRSTKILYLHSLSHDPFEQERTHLPRLFATVDSLAVVDIQTDPMNDMFACSHRDSTETETVHIPLKKWKPWWYECQLEGQMSFVD